MIMLVNTALYPGEIRDSVSHGDEKLIEVKFMSVMGRNKFVWQDGMVDINEYPEEDVLCLIPESRRTSKRYTSLEEGIWNKIETLYGKE